jgi:hypothetical protein
MARDCSDVVFDAICRVHRLVLHVSVRESRTQPWGCLSTAFAGPIAKKFG